MSSQGLIRKLLISNLCTTKPAVSMALFGSGHGHNPAAVELTCQCALSVYGSWSQAPHLLFTHECAPQCYPFCTVQTIHRWLQAALLESVLLKALAQCTSGICLSEVSSSSSSLEDVLSAIFQTSLHHRRNFPGRRSG